MNNNDTDQPQEQGLGLFFGVIEYDKRPDILWSGSTWHSDTDTLDTWALLLTILNMKDKSDFTSVEWSFLPIIWDEIEIFALTRVFLYPGGSVWLVIFHQVAEKLTQFLLQHEENIGTKFYEILENPNSSIPSAKLSNEQLKQIRINCQQFYEALSQI